MSLKMFPARVLLLFGSACGVAVAAAAEAGSAAYSPESEARLLRHLRDAVKPAVIAATCRPRYPGAPRGYTTCTCPSGYKFGADPNTCEDYNECETRLRRCINAQCVNTPGSYRCQCKQGFQPSQNPAYAKFFCEDIDECKSECKGKMQRCVNYNSAYKCIDFECPHGYNISKAYDDSLFCKRGAHCRQDVGAAGCSAQQIYRSYTSLSAAHTSFTYLFSLGSPRSRVTWRVENVRLAEGAHPASRRNFRLLLNPDGRTATFHYGAQLGSGYKEFKLVIFVESPYEYTWRGKTLEQLFKYTMELYIIYAD